MFKYDFSVCLSATHSVLVLGFLCWMLLHKLSGPPFQSISLQLLAGLERACWLPVFWEHVRDEFSLHQAPDDMNNADEEGGILALLTYPDT